MKKRKIQNYFKRTFAELETLNHVYRDLHGNHEGSYEERLLRLLSLNETLGVNCQNCNSCLDCHVYICGLEDEICYVCNVKNQPY